MLDHLLGVADKYVPNRFSMLDIGAGTGKFARSFLKRCRVPVQEYIAIEPSADHVTQIRKNLDGIPVEKEIICDFFTPATGFGKKYDLPLLSHCTYGFLPDPEPYLLHALEVLNNRVVAVIYHGSPTNFCYILNLIWRDILPTGRVTNPTFTSWNVRDILEKHNKPPRSYLPPKSSHGTRDLQPEWRAPPRRSDHVLSFGGVRLTPPRRFSGREKRCSGR